MPKSFRYFVRASQIVVGLGLLAATVRAEDPVPPTPPGSSLPPSSATPGANSTPPSSPTPGKRFRLGAGRAGAGQGGQRLAKLKEELNLTPEQTKKLTPILEQAGAKLKALQQNTALTDEQKRPERRQVFVEVLKGIRPILTPAQVEKLKELRGARGKGPATAA